MKLDQRIIKDTCKIMYINCISFLLHFYLIHFIKFRSITMFISVCSKNNIFISFYLTKESNPIPAYENPAFENGNLENDQDNRNQPNDNIKSDTICVVRRTWVWLLTLFITFACSFSVYPGITVIIKSVDYGKVYSKYFYILTNA